MKRPVVRSSGHVLTITITDNCYCTKMAIFVRVYCVFCVAAFVYLSVYTFVFVLFLCRSHKSMGRKKRRRVSFLSHLAALESLLGRRLVRKNNSDRRPLRPPLGSVALWHSARQHAFLNGCAISRPLVISVLGHVFRLFVWFFLCTSHYSILKKQTKKTTTTFPV